MKKKIFSLILSVLMVVTLLPASAFASKTAQVAKIGDTTYETLGEALEAAEYFDTVELLIDITDSTEDITVPELVFLDLNNHKFVTSGTVVNNGGIILHQENAEIVDYLLYNVPGAYGLKEGVKLPNDSEPDYVVPSGTFLTSEVSKECLKYQELGFASGDEPLVWNKDIPQGMQLDVTYNLELGGDILSSTAKDVKSTKVSANIVKLNKDITIGSNEKGAREATLFVESLYTFDDEIGVLNANGHKITLNKSGKLVLSSDVEFDPSILVSGDENLSVVKEENKTQGTVTYYLGKASEDNCVYDRTAKLVDGSFELKLNGKGQGKFQFNEEENGWLISTSRVKEVHQAIKDEGARKLYLSLKDNGVILVGGTFDEEEEYLGVENGKLVYTDENNATQWTYRNGAFYVREKASKFGRATTYYLSTVEEGAKLSKCFTFAEVYEEMVATGHDLGFAKDLKDGTHKAICKRCGEAKVADHKFNKLTHKCICKAYDPNYQEVTVTANYGTKKSFNLFSFLFGKKNVTYFATANVEATGLKVLSVQVSLTSNGGWVKSSTLCSKSEIEEFFVKVKTNDGKTREFMMIGDVCYPAN